MKKLLFLLLMWSTIVPSCLFAQHLTEQQHIPLTTDSLVGYKLPYVTVTDSGKNCVWNFSGLSTDSAEIIEVNYYAAATDTMHIGLHREHANFCYHFTQDTLWQTGYETSHSRVQYLIPMLYFPFGYGDSIKGEFIGNGQYCHLLPIHTNGSYTACADATGKLQLPDMTVDSVLRWHTIMRYHETTRRSTTIQEERYLWYSMYCRYPLLETVLINTMRGNDTISFSSTYYYPQEQEDDPSLDFLKQEDDLEQTTMDSIVTNVGYLPNPVYSDVQIRYTLSRSAQVYISLHYNGGVTTYQTPVHREEEGSHVVSVNMSGMPIGSYVVYIHADEEVVSGSLIKL